MTGSLILDTNIVVALLNNMADVKVKVQESTTFISNTILGVLYFGAEKSSRIAENVEKIRSFARGITTLPIDDLTAHASTAGSRRPCEGSEGPFPRTTSGSPPPPSVMTSRWPLRTITSRRSSA